MASYSAPTCTCLISALGLDKAALATTTLWVGWLVDVADAGFDTEPGSYVAIVIALVTLLSIRWRWTLLVIMIMFIAARRNVRLGWTYAICIGDRQ